jgi:predicted O-methyltransferase YrrM
MPSRGLRVWLERVRECHNPAVLASAVRNIFRRRRLLTFATGLSAAALSAYVREIESDETFVLEIRERLTAWTSYEPRAVDFMMAGEGGSVFFNEVTLYALVRGMRPSLVVETGGTPGKSTAFILRAMELNGVGHLSTIDVPPPPAPEAGRIPRARYHDLLPAGAASNWIVPESLRARHTLLLGRSRDRLPALLAGLDRVDIFLHDSDHSYENMMWEFEAAWPKVRDGGLLVSDDVLANTAFVDFCRNESLEHERVFNLGIARRSQMRRARGSG